MFLEVTDKMNGKRKMINGAYIYSIVPSADGTGALVKYDEGSDRAKIIQTEETYKNLWNSLFPVSAVDVAEYEKKVAEYLANDVKATENVFKNGI